MPDAPAIRIVKKAKGHHGHHGGAWKVAMADFMTALMAFFLVMWIMGLSQETRRAIEGYFKDPIGFTAGFENGRNPIALTGFPEGGKDKTGAQLADAVGGSRGIERRGMQEAKRQIEKALRRMRQTTSLASQVRLNITDEGLRIELEDRLDAAFFAIGSAHLNPEAEQILKLIAQQLGELPNRVIIEGHTDARQYTPGSYSNWELSFDRANTARLTMKKYGRESQLSQVRAFADTRPRVPSDPYHYTNRRVSILLEYSDLSDAGRKPGSLKEQVFGSARLTPRFQP